MIILAQGSDPLCICFTLFSFHQCTFMCFRSYNLSNSQLFFFNSTEIVAVVCVAMKVAVTEAGIKFWVAVCKMFCLLLVLSVAVPGASVFVVHCHIKCCLGEKANIFFTGCSDVF